MTAGWHAPEPERPTCLLCGDTADVTMALVRYRDDGIFNSVPRCRDHDACRRRVEASGGTWDIDEGRYR